MLKKSDPTHVFKAYNEIADWFDQHRCKDLSLEKKYLTMLQQQLPEKATVLDIGCGTGEPIAQFFINQGYRVTGIDASQTMISCCQKRFPSQRWLLADMRSLCLSESFNLVIAWHSVFHVPPQDQHDTLKILIAHLKNDGLLVFTSGDQAGEVWSDNGGYDLYHASLSMEEYEHIITSNGCQVLLHQKNDPECGGATVWIAQKT